MSKKKIMVSLVISAVLILMMYLIIDVFLNGHIREFVYSQFLEQFSYGWERLRSFIYIIGFLLIANFIFLYFILPDILVRKRFKKEQAILARKLSSFLQSDDDIITLDKKYFQLEQELNKLKLNLIQSKMAMQETEFKRNELISNIAHDLNTPLTSIIGYLILLNDEENLPEDIRKKYIAICLNKSSRVEELITEFFELTQLTSRDVILHKENLNLYEMLEQITEEFFPLLEDKHLKFNIDCESDIVINVDGNQLSRVFENLFKNAISYSSTNTEICIHVFKNNKQTIIHISNETNKIKQSQIDRIFERNYRGDQARNSQTGGSGLGLAIAKEIIEQNGGGISAYIKNNRITFEIILKE